jgi:hypothetical protein
VAALNLIQVKCPKPIRNDKRIEVTTTTTTGDIANGSKTASKEQGFRFVPKADIGRRSKSVAIPSSSASYCRRLRAAGHRSRARRALGAIITTIGDVVRSLRNLVRYAGMLKSPLDGQPSFPRGAPRATWGRRGD